MTQAQSLSRNSDFLRLWAAQFGSAIGSRITRTALPMLALLLVDATPAQIALLAACEVTPGLLVSLVAGGLADRRARRPLLIGADLVRAALILTLPLLAAFQALAMWQLYLVAAGIGAASTLFAIVDNTFLPSLVAPQRLTEANARLEASDAVAEGIGPWAGGALVQLVGAPVALVIDAVSYLWSAALLFGIRTREAARREAAPASLLADAAEGLRRCRASPALGLLLGVEALRGLSGGFLMALYVVIGLQHVGIGPATLGLIIGIGGIGAFLGALAAPPLQAALGEGAAMRASLIFGQTVAMTVPLAILFPGAGVWLLIAGQLFGDAALVAYGILALSMRQRIAPEQVLGRVNASFHLGAQSALLAGVLLAGGLATVLPMAAVVWTGVAIGFLAIPLILRIAPDTVQP